MQSRSASTDLISSELPLRTNSEVVLAGNPNSGKTSLFNALTGAHQHVGNWPGKTVSWMQGRSDFNGHEVQVVDLPGAYSLSAYSAEESLAREYILERSPDAVIVVVDATNLERHLYLAVQVLELTPNVILALNMSDQAAKLNLSIDLTTLSEGLGAIPIVRTVASRGEGVRELQEAVFRLICEAASLRKSQTQATHCCSSKARRWHLPYSGPIEAEIDRLISVIEDLPAHTSGFDSRWLALQLLEGEDSVVERVAEGSAAQVLVHVASEGRTRLEKEHEEAIPIVMADRRYAFVAGLTERVLEAPEREEETFLERLDRLVTSRWLGIPIFLLVMYFVFNIVVNVSAPYLDWVDGVIAGPVSSWANILLSAIRAPAWLNALILSGVVPGVGGVLVFLPGLVALYFFIGLLEDSGYLSRAAFVMDRFMSLLGLHGKSFVPMILGFGCSVPAVYATRMLENKRERILTALLVPFMSCSARLPVYVVFSLAFFPQAANLVIFALYGFGILVAILSGLLFSRTVLSAGEAPAFVLELPPYRLPNLRSLWNHVMQRTWHFIRNAGTVILAASMVIWLLLNLPWGRSGLRESWFGSVSSAAAPVFTPAGFGTWEAAGSLMTGLVAKEVVVSTMAQIHLGESDDLHPPVDGGSFREDVVAIGRGFSTATVQSGQALLRAATPFLTWEAKTEPASSTALSAELEEHFSPAAALAFLVFTLLYVPCVATLGALRSEFGWKWAVFSAAYQTGSAWMLAVIVFQIGRLAGLA